MLGLPFDRVALDHLDLEYYRKWGIHRHPLLFGPRLKVLFVVDGPIDLSTNGFGLGKVLDTLRAPYAWWVRFTVDVARRRIDPNQPGGGAPVIVTAPGPYEFKYDFFRFDMPGFSLDDYDQVWFFGFNPGNDDGPDANIGSPSNSPLTDPELVLLATWMDAGGGVFATGDHDYLGASMCSRIPRVRTMRKWTNAQGVPPIDGSTRHDTNQPANPAQASNAEFMPFGLEGDHVPQPVEVVLEPLWSRFAWIRRYAPHPILCSKDGVIDVFPDHPHEGEVIDDQEVELDLPSGIVGWAGPEYPGGQGRPTPHVIAYGRSTHNQTFRVKGALDPRRFGMVGVYDGESANVGRVVVDSTWHHWFSLNLIGLESGNLPAYRLVQHYFRNVGIWLATPAQRVDMLLAATWGIVIGSGPMEFPPTVTWHELGGRALDVIGRTASRCLILAWAADFFMVEEIRGIRFPDPCLTCPEEDLLERVVLGGMARGLVNLALEYQTMAAQGGRPTPDPNAIAEGATIGVREAQRGFVEALQENAGTNPELARRFDSAARQNELRAPDLGLRRVRIALEAIQITDPLDPALIEDALDIAVRVVVDGNLLASRVFEQVHIQDPDRRGIVLRIDEVLAEVTMWEGSALGISLAASDDATGVTPRPEDYRGSVVLDGPPQTWDRVRRTPGWPQDTWRAWIRIDVED